MNKSATEDWKTTRPAKEDYWRSGKKPRCYGTEALTVTIHSGKLSSVNMSTGSAIKPQQTPVALHTSSHKQAFNKNRKYTILSSAFSAEALCLIYKPRIPLISQFPSSYTHPEAPITSTPHFL